MKSHIPGEEISLAERRNIFCLSSSSDDIPDLSEISSCDVNKEESSWDISQSSLDESPPLLQSLGNKYKKYFCYNLEGRSYILDQAECSPAELWEFIKPLKKINEASLNKIIKDSTHDHKFNDLVGEGLSIKTALKIFMYNIYNFQYNSLSVEEKIEEFKVYNDTGFSLYNFNNSIRNLITLEEIIYYVNFSTKLADLYSSKAFGKDLTLAIMLKYSALNDACSHFESYLLEKNLPQLKITFEALNILDKCLEEEIEIFDAKDKEKLDKLFMQEKIEELNYQNDLLRDRIGELENMLDICIEKRFIERSQYSDYILKSRAPSYGDRLKKIGEDCMKIPSNPWKSNSYKNYKSPSTEKYTKLERKDSFSFRNSSESLSDKIKSFSKYKTDKDKSRDSCSDKSKDKNLQIELNFAEIDLMADTYEASDF